MTDSYFLGCNSASGFVSLFSELYDPYDGWNMYIIKGGPGTGKSTLMKKIASKAEKKGYTVEKIYCSSDPDSLDGVIIEDIKTAIADGTSPHVLEPKFAGACERIINLGDFWDEKVLKENRDEIIKYSTMISAQHGSCVRYLRAAQMIQNEISATVANYTDTDKIERYIKREMRGYDLNKGKEAFTVKNRIVTAATPDGLTTFKSPIFNHAETATIFKDPYNVIAPAIIERLATDFIDNKNSIIKCRTFLNPTNKTEHIILPELHTAYLTEWTGQGFESEKRKINITRFTTAGFKDSVKETDIAVKARNCAIKEATKHLKTAKELHDILEQYYINAMDYDKLNAYTDKFISECFT